MRKVKLGAVDLGTLQSNLEMSTADLKQAQRAKQRADQVYEEALEQHERSKVALNGAVSALKSASVVPNLYAG